MPITKRQVLAMLALYSITRGVIDELRPVDDHSEESCSYDKVAFDAVIDSVKHMVDESATAKAGMEDK